MFGYGELSLVWLTTRQVPVLSGAGDPPSLPSVAAFSLLSPDCQPWDEEQWGWSPGCSSPSCALDPVALQPPGPWCRGLSVGLSIRTGSGNLSFSDWGAQQPTGNLSPTQPSFSWSYFNPHPGSSSVWWEKKETAQPFPLRKPSHQADRCRFDSIFLHLK